MKIGLPSTTPIVNTTIQYQTTPCSCQSSKSQHQFKLRTKNDVLCSIGQKNMANVSAKETCTVTQRRIELDPFQKQLMKSQKRLKQLHLNTMSEKVAEEVDEYDDEIESDDDDDVEPGSKYEPRNEYSVETDYSYNLCTRSGRSIRPVSKTILC